MVQVKYGNHEIDFEWNHNGAVVLVDIIMEAMRLNDELALSISILHLQSCKIGNDQYDIDHSFSQVPKRVEIICAEKNGLRSIKVSKFDSTCEELLSSINEQYVKLQAMKKNRIKKDIPTSKPLTLLVSHTDDISKFSPMRGHISKEDMQKATSIVLEKLKRQDLAGLSAAQRNNSVDDFIEPHIEEYLLNFFLLDSTQNSPSKDNEAKEQTTNRSKIKSITPAYHTTPSKTIEFDTDDSKLPSVINLPAATEAVFDACKTGNVILLQKYISTYGAEVITELRNSTQFTPLHIACQFNQDRICNELISNGADIFAIAKMDMTPLHVASNAGHMRTVQLLMNHDADPFLQNKLGLSSIDVARRSNHSEIVDFLSKIYT